MSCSNINFGVDNFELLITTLCVFLSSGDGDLSVIVIGVDLRVFIGVFWDWDCDWDNDEDDNDKSFVVGIVFVGKYVFKYSDFTVSAKFEGIDTLSFLYFVFWITFLFVFLFAFIPSSFKSI